MEIMTQEQLKSLSIAEEVKQFLIKKVNLCIKKFDNEFFTYTNIEIEYTPANENETDIVDLFLIYIFLKRKLPLTEYRISRMLEIRKEIFQNEDIFVEKKYKFNYNIIEVLQ